MRHIAIRVCDIRTGTDSHFDAWLYSLLMDNNLAYQLNPHLIASQEQLAFMVHLKEGQVYIPTSDATFALLGSRDAALQAQYNRVWRTVIQLVRASMPDKATRKSVLEFCRLRFQQYTAQSTLLPSRLMKRMTDLILHQSFSPLDDPWIEKRKCAFEKHASLMKNELIQRAFDRVEIQSLSGSMKSIRDQLHALELVRLFVLNLNAPDWELGVPDSEEVRDAFQQAEKAAAPFTPKLVEMGRMRATVLFLCDAQGSVFFDLATVASLIRMGFRVIYAVKDNFFFMSPTMEDIKDEPYREYLGNQTAIICEKDLSKNALLRELKSHSCVIINDGTRERLNLYRVSLTFARAWKEADLILAHGWRACDTLLGTSHSFTRDILCFTKDEKGQYHMEMREHDQSAHKFSEQDINRQADAIIRCMREAHKEQRSVMFFSCIIGSIPGQTRQAVQLATVFVESLRERLDNVLIINPAEHFIEGMDGDDLMYMWERVQRSGEIDIWRFQSSSDIEESFALLGRKVPQIWSGKDATYSTGCTKEMQIALDVQRKNPEMQIIGPDPRLFFRRGEYGVGSYFDANLKKR